MGHPSPRRSSLPAAVAIAAIAAIAVGACTSAAPPVSPTPTTAAPTAAPADSAPATAAPPASAAAPAASGGTGDGGYGDGGYGRYGDGYATAAPSMPAASGGPAGATGALGTKDISGIGTVLVGPTGMTLYTYARDTAGKSACTGGCAGAWPPLRATTVPALPAGFSGRVTLIARDDGSQQVAYDGHPLYGFSGDSAPGDANGQGSGGVWFVVTK